ncbi:hypothetical protein V6N13_128370 [Hibiscus sabdariffa]|uniref:Pectinesterase n=1 Tax=Hibiscus sabdariffa TaxID=183260 RepID=A0ABR2P104_9ROSI
MQCLFALVFIVLLLQSSVSEGFECKSGAGNQPKLANTIRVDKSGSGDFSSVQKAIDSIPPNNDRWRHIHISPGIYREKVTIPIDKPCIFLEGSHASLTIIEWNEHNETSNSATFSSFPDNIVARGISFKNFYDIPPVVVDGNSQVAPALAARIYGDKSAFYNCAFYGLQDTLWDVEGHHYFYRCYIEGAIDFIFGSGQSIYEGCVVNLTLGKYATEYPNGYITAQGRNSSEDPSGFVFKYCNFVGSGKTYLGRAYGPYSRVIIYKSALSDMIVPAGWDAWDYVHHEENLMYVEHGCWGAGAGKSGRVPWMTQLSAAQLNQFVRLSYIDKDGWIEKLPIKP